MSEDIISKLKVFGHFHPPKREHKKKRLLFFPLSVGNEIRTTASACVGRGEGKTVIWTRFPFSVF